jgi:N-acetylmuramoyl-L-alanine amidase
MRVGGDGGHGKRFGRYIGARGNELVEDEVVFSYGENLGLVQRLGHILRSRGHDTIYTRQTDEALASVNYLDLRRRVSIVRTADCDLLVSLHCNAAKDKSANGFEVFYPPNSEASEGYAKAVCDAVKRAMGDSLKVRGYKLDSKSQHKSLFILRNAGCPAILIEAGFLSSEKDAKNLKDKMYRQRLCEAIADGIDIERERVLNANRKPLVSW